VVPMQTHTRAPGWQVPHTAHTTLHARRGQGTLCTPAPQVDKTLGCRQKAHFPLGSTCRFTL